MSEKALPLIFLNLSGEMLYVLDQRLYAQKIQEEKGKKIMQDIATHMFSERFLDEIFKPQQVCSRKALRIIFERLAHTSIMRLNESSMDKLYDLMTMALKYQMTLTEQPREIILVTLNHLDSIMPFLEHSPQCTNLIEQCYKRVFESYLNLSDFEIQFIRHTILNFLQDLKIKVSVFIREKVQNWEGKFVLPCDGPVPFSCNIPGTIIYYGDEGQIYKESTFNPGAKYHACEKNEGSYKRNGDRVTKLGLNVYSSTKVVDTIVSSERNTRVTNIASDLESNVPDPKAKAQLDLLCRLIGKSSGSASSSSTSSDFKLNLFNNEEEEFIYKTQVKSGLNQEENVGKVVSFDASKRVRDERLNKVMDEFYEKGPSSKSHGKRDSKPSKNAINDNDDYDDDNDIVALIDRLNK